MERQIKQLNQMRKMIILSSTAMILVCNFHSQWWGSSIQVLHSLDPLLEPINLSRKKTSMIPEQGLRSPMHTFALSLCTFIPLKSKIIAPTFLTFLDLSKTEWVTAFSSRVVHTLCSAQKFGSTQILSKLANVSIASEDPHQSKCLVNCFNFR